MKYFAAIGLIVSVFFGAVFLLKRDTGSGCHEPQPPAQIPVKAFSKIELERDAYTIVILSSGDLLYFDPSKLDEKSKQQLKDLRDRPMLKIEKEPSESDLKEAFEELGRIAAEEAEIEKDAWQKFRLSKKEIAEVLAAINDVNYFAIKSDGIYPYTYNVDPECQKLRSKGELRKVHPDEIQLCTSADWRSRTSIVLPDGRAHSVTDKGCGSVRYATFEEKIVVIAARLGISQAQTEVCDKVSEEECWGWQRSFQKLK